MGWVIGLVILVIGGAGAYAAYNAAQPGDAMMQKDTMEKSGDAMMKDDKMSGDKMSSTSDAMMQDDKMEKSGDAMEKKDGAMMAQ